MSPVPCLRISGYAEIDWKRICYWKTADGTWKLYLPGCGVGDLTNHRVIEHEDGTITVEPSILVTGHQDIQRHGYITNGQWRDA